MRKLETPEDVIPPQALQEQLLAEVPNFDSLVEESRKSLLAAEHLYRVSGQTTSEIDLSRASGFSFAFSVESEARARLFPKVRQLAEAAETPDRLNQLLEPDKTRLSIFFEQYLIRTLHLLSPDLTAENFMHTFRRMAEHGPRYRPDGLKALGMIVITFGRFYSFQKGKEEVEMYNPLKFSGLTDSDAVLGFGRDLIRLQHMRNPYVHSEWGEPSPLEEMREQAISLLNRLTRL